MIDIYELKLKKNYSVFEIRYNFLPSSSIILIIVPGPSIIPLVRDGLLKERLYCSIVSKATVSLVIKKLGSF